LLGIDAIHLYGSLNKNEFFWLIQFFCLAMDVDELHVQVLLTTLATGIGIKNLLWNVTSISVGLVSCTHTLNDKDVVVGS